MGVEIAQAEDGRIARLIEHELGKRFAERVRFGTKLAGITKPADGSALYDALSGLKEEGQIVNGEDIGDVMHFEYFDREFWVQPQLIQPQENMTIEGDVVGVKGRMLVLERFDTLYVVNLHQLLGYDITEEANGEKGKNQLQTSMDAFMR